MVLAERAGLSELISAKVAINESRVRSAAVNPAGKLTSIIAGMVAGAECIDDLEVIRSGGMPRLFAQVYAPATLGQFLREFTQGHGLQLASVARAHLVNLVEHAALLPGIEGQAYVDIDSLLRPVFGQAKQGASDGHTKIAGRQVLRKGLSPLATTISTREGAPVIAGIRLRAGRAGSGRGAASMLAQAINTARAAGATGDILARGDSAYRNSAVINACIKAGARFSFVLTNNATVNRAIASIPEHAWTPVHYPGAVVDPDTGELISDAPLAEVAFTNNPVTARLIVRRVRDQTRLEELFPVWRYHPFFTNSLESTAEADITHRRHSHQPTACPRARCDATTPDRRRPRPAGPAATPPDPAPTRALALGHTVDHPVAQDIPTGDRPTRAPLTPTTHRTGLTGDPSGTAGQTSRDHTPAPH